MTKKLIIKMHIILDGWETLESEETLEYLENALKVKVESLCGEVTEYNCIENN